MRFHLSYLGCRLNYAEISELECEIVRRGHTLVDDPARADWAIINTCTVTHVAARKSRQAIRSLSRRNPLLKVAAIGCYAEISPNAVADLPSPSFRHFGFAATLHKLLDHPIFAS